jgi:hypothetical protein
MKVLLFIMVLSLAACDKEYTIRQEVRNCFDNTQFQVDTYIIRQHDGIRETIYNSRTWLKDGFGCLVLDSVLSRKEHELRLAESFLSKYKRVFNSKPQTNE